MAKFQFGDILLMNFPFTSGQQAKRRPALVLLDVDDEDVIIARITSKERKTEFDVALLDWRQAGLIIPSVVRLDKLHTMQKKKIEKELGKLSNDDRQSIRKVFGILCARITKNTANSSRKTR